jgi:hypothetical protein
MVLSYVIETVNLFTSGFVMVINYNLKGFNPTIWSLPTHIYAAMDDLFQVLFAEFISKGNKACVISFSGSEMK